jgi:hypothetical protein
VPTGPGSLAEFSAAHDGWLVSVDILSPDIGAQPDIKEGVQQHLDSQAQTNPRIVPPWSRPVRV